MAAGSLTLWNCRLIDGLGGVAKEHGFVVIQDGQIGQIADTAGAAMPDDGTWKAGSSYRA